VNHLAKQKNTFARILPYCPVADLNCILYPIAESEVPGDDKLYLAKIQNGRIKVFFPEIVISPLFFDFSNNGRLIIFGYIEFFDGQSFLIAVKLTVFI